MKAVWFIPVSYTHLDVYKRQETRGKIGYFGGINKAKFRKKVQPGSLLRMEIEVVKRRGPVAVVSGKAYADDGLAAEGEMTFMIGE